MTRFLTPMLLILQGLLSGVLAQTATHPVLKAYIQYALDSNLVVRQKTVGLEKSMLALQEARSYFLPAVQLGGSYSLAHGGRSIEFPVGDLLNPVYSTLNQLTGTTKFPQISNVEEHFLPNNFYDIKLRTTYPILNPEFKYNRQVKEHQIKLSEAEIDIYKRELVKDVKTAYYTYLLATEGTRIYENTKVVVERGLRVNESLYKNGKGLPAYINRSEADVQQVDAQWQSAKNEAEKAKAYFNFLLNRSLNEPIEIHIPELPETLMLPDTDLNTITNREELAQLKTAEEINKSLIRLNESFRQPRVNTYFDLGSQGFDFVNSGKGPYYMFGLQVDMPIFQGKRNLYKIDQSKKDLEQTRTQQQLVAQQLELQAFNSRNNVLTALSNYRAGQKQVQAAASYFKLIDRGRSEGTNTFIEWLDARNQLTTAEVQQQISKYKALSAYADYERQIASVSLD
jgi:outer membrane protein TolC